MSVGPLDPSLSLLQPHQEQTEKQETPNPLENFVSTINETKRQGDETPSGPRNYTHDQTSKKIIKPFELVFPPKISRPKANGFFNYDDPSYNDFLLSLGSEIKGMPSDSTSSPRSILSTFSPRSTLPTSSPRNILPTSSPHGILSTKSQRKAEKNDLKKKQKFNELCNYIRFKYKNFNLIPYCDIESLQNKGSPILFALSHKDYELLRLLIDASADVTQVDQNGDTLLDLLMKLENKTVGYGKFKKEDIDPIVKDIINFLVYTKKLPFKLDSFKTLISNANSFDKNWLFELVIHVLNNDNFVSLSEAILQNKDLLDNNDIMNLLFYPVYKKGFKISWIDSEGNSLLPHLIGPNNDFTVLKFFISETVDLSYENEEGGITKLEIVHQADTNIPDKHGNFVLDSLMNLQNFTVVKHMNLPIKNGISSEWQAIIKFLAVSKKSPFKMNSFTSLINSCVSYDMDWLLELVQEVVNRENVSAIAHALINNADLICNEPMIEIIFEMLFEKGLEIDCLDKQGRSLLYKAVGLMNKNLVILFMKNGANPRLQRTKGRKMGALTPLDLVLAKESNLISVIEKTNEFKKLDPIKKSQLIRELNTLKSNSLEYTEGNNIEQIFNCQEIIAAMSR